MTINARLATRTAFTRANPLSRIGSALILALPNLVNPSVRVALITVAVALGTAISSTQLPSSFIARALAWSCLAGLGVGVANALGSAADGVSARADVATLTGLRLIAVILPGLLAFATVDPVDLADAAVRQLQIPIRAAYGVVAALRLAPALARDWQTLRDAERARGVGGRWLSVRRLSALLVSAIRRADRTALALDARGFDTLPQFAAGPSTWSRTDTAWLLGATAVATGLLIFAA